MSRKQISRTLMVALAAGLLTVGAAAAQGPIATQAGAAQIEWQSEVGGALALSVSGPEGFHLQQRFAAGETAVFSVFDAAGELRPAGSYAFEVRVEPVLDEETRGELQALRDAGEGLGTLAKSGKIPSEATVHSGYFAIEGGAVVMGGAEEADAGKPAGGAQLTAKDQVILDDLIVDGSLCVGFDCINGESFGFDTIRLKENNLRIKFLDTSNSASFPQNDWQLTANDSSNGGAEKFSIDDVSASRTPFTIEAGSRSHSLYVDSNNRVGFGTNTPVTDLHVKSGNTPTLRLEQDGTSGFSPQTWDVAGNETNFFVRDATNGSTLPFRIRPGAPSNSIYIEQPDGDVGLGTTSPQAGIHVNRSTGSTTTGMRLTNNDIVQFELENTAETSGIGDTRWSFQYANDGDFRINKQGSGALEFELQADGDLIISGTYTPDYVFEPDYDLMSLEELETFIQENKHLPNVPSDAEVKRTRRINLSEFQLRLLEKIEELTLHTITQHKQIKTLQARLGVEEE